MSNDEFCERADQVGGVFAWDYDGEIEDTTEGQREYANRIAEVLDRAPESIAQDTEPLVKIAEANAEAYESGKPERAGNEAFVEAIHDYPDYDGWDRVEEWFIRYCGVDLQDYRDR